MNEFKARNKYQDFTVYFNQTDTGFREPRVINHGATTLWWDKVTIELVEPWTEAQLAAHYQSFAKPAGITREKHDGLNVLAVRGLYNRLYHIDDAVAALPGAKLVPPTPRMMNNMAPCSRASPGIGNRFTRRISSCSPTWRPRG